MGIFRTIIDVITVLLSTVVFCYGISKTAKNKKWLLYHFFFLLFVVPLALDYLISKVQYDSWHWYGYHISCDDNLTSVIYDLCICLITGFFVFLNIRKKEPLQTKNLSFSPFLKYSFLFITLFTPFLFFACSILFRFNPFFIFKFGWRYSYDSGLMSDIPGYGACERLTYISCAASVILLLSFDYKNYFSLFKRENLSQRKKAIVLKSLYLLSIALSLGFSILIEGKRSILLYVGIILIVALIVLFVGKIKKWKIILVSIVGLVILTPLFIFLSNQYRVGISGGLDAKSYASLRIDLFRDQSLKYAIYCSIHHEECNILNYPFQSYFTESFFLFPLVYLPIPFKVGYETYLTSSVLFCNIDQLPTMRFTNSGIDELYANFSFFGIFVFVAMLFYLHRILNKISKEESIIFYCLYILFMMYTTSYICWFYEFVVVIYILKKIASKFLSKPKSVVILEEQYEEIEI